MIKQRYHQPAATKNDDFILTSKKHLKTNPIDAGYLNLRIKSSKAFPMSDVSVIEELISKVRKNDPAGGDSREPLDYMQTERLRVNNNNTVNGKIPHLNSGSKQMFASQTVSHSVKPHSYEFLKQQMRDLKKEINDERRANRFSS